MVSLRNTIVKYPSSDRATPNRSDRGGGSRSAVYPRANDGIVAPTGSNTAWACAFSDVYSGDTFKFVNDAGFSGLSAATWSNSSAFGGDVGDDLICIASFRVAAGASPDFLGIDLVGPDLLRRRGNAARPVRAS
jgi:hypothetical protein